MDEGTDFSSSHEEDDETSPERVRLEERETKVKDYKKHSLTTEERDEIVQKYNAEHSHKRKASDVADSNTDEKLIGPEEDVEKGEVSKFITPEKEKIDSEEVRKLYLEDELSLKKIGETFGFKSGKPIKRILEAEGLEVRPTGFQKIEIDHDEVHKLYFDESRSLKEIAEYFGCKSTTPILRIFDEQGWKTRYQETYETEIDPEEVFRLYNEDGLSIREIGEYYGVSYSPILRVFQEHNMEYGQEIRIDPEVIHHLYFEEGLSKEEVCERLGVSKRPIDRILEEQGWEARPAGFQPVDIDIDEFKRLYYEEELPLEEMANRLEVSESTLVRYRKEQNLEIRDLTTTRELRDKIFGKECVTCGKPRRDIHKKNGEQHLSEILWRKKDLLTLNPDDWAALCRPCHRLTHSLMKNFGCEWSEIETTLKELARKRLS